MILVVLNYTILNALMLQGARILISKEKWLNGSSSIHESNCFHIGHISHLVCIVHRPNPNPTLTLDQVWYFEGIKL